MVYLRKKAPRGQAILVEQSATTKIEVKSSKILNSKPLTLPTNTRPRREVKRTEKAKLLDQQKFENEAKSIEKTPKSVAKDVSLKSVERPKNARGIKIQTEPSRQKISEDISVSKPTVHRGRHSKNEEIQGKENQNVNIRGSSRIKRLSDQNGPDSGKSVARLTRRIEPNKSGTKATKTNIETPKTCPSAIASSSSTRSKNRAGSVKKSKSCDSEKTQLSLESAIVRPAEDVPAVKRSMRKYSSDKLPNRKVLSRSGAPKSRLVSERNENGKSSESKESDKKVSLDAMKTRKKKSTGWETLSTN